MFNIVCNNYDDAIVLEFQISLFQVFHCLVLYEFNFWITVFADEREKVQRKTFTKWINSHLQRVGARVNDMYHDLQDGKKLILLLEILSGEKLVRAFTYTNI